LLSVTITAYDVFFSVCFFTHDYWIKYDPDDETGLHTLESISKRDCFAINKIARPIIACIPVTWRALQCLRRYRDTNDTAQLWNFGKYCTSYFVIVSASLYQSVDTNFLPLWLICIVGSTCYTYYWDLVRDWSFIILETSGIRVKSISTRTEERLLPDFSYYVGLASNLLLRLLWTLTVSPDAIPLDPLITETGLSVLECLRRAQWNIFRLENEQINNIGKFRAVRTVPVALPKEQKEFLERFSRPPAASEYAELDEESSDGSLSAPSSGDDDAVVLPLEDEDSVVDSVVFSD
jgi:xenotropic and polytropic retrovirus receptor 1